MAEKKTFFTDLKKVMFNGKFNRAIFGETIGSIGEAMRMMYNGEIVFNRAEYYLSVPEELSIEATGDTWESILGGSIASYKTDRDGIRTDIEVTYPEGNISRNDSEDEVRGTYTVTQAVTGQQISGTYVQEGKKFMKYYIDINNIIVENVNYDAVGAGGGSSAPYVTVVADKYAEYSNGTSEYVGRSVGTAYVSNAVGKAADLSDLHLVNYADATLNTGTGEVSVSSLTTNETDAPITVFNVTHLEGGVVFEEHDGVLSWRWDGSVEVEQDINSRNLVDTDYFMSSRIVDDELESTETLIVVRGHAYRIDYFRYDAIPSQLYEETSDSRLYVTLDNAPESVLYIEGEEDMDVSFNVGVNGTAFERIFSVQVYNSSAGYNEEYEVKQLARVFMKYTVTRVQAMEASYEEAYPYASTCAPIIRVRVWYVAEYSDGTHDAEFYEDQSSGVSVSSANGSPYDYSGATINKSTGVVSVPSLPHQADNGGKVFTVTSLAGTVKAKLTGTSHSWTWSGSAEVSQMANEEVLVGTDNIRKSSVASSSIGYSNEYVTVYYQVQDVNVWKWASDKNGDYSWREVLKNYPLTISISGDYSDSKSVSDGEGSVSFHVGANSSTSSQRSFTVTVKSSTLGTIGTHSVKQGVNVYQENWNIPVLNGSISVGTVPAGGGSVTVYVPIYQEKTSNTGGVVETYEKTVAAIGLSGSGSNGGSASGGSVSASSLGTTTTSSARLIYTITAVTVRGGDGVSYTLTLPSPVNVYQARNGYHFTTTRRDVSLSVSHSSINSDGTTSSGGYPVLTFGGMQYGYYWYDSAPDTHYTPSDLGTMALNVSTSSGSLSPSGTQYGTGKTATLYADQNESLESVDVVVTLRAYDHWSSETAGSPVVKTVTLTQAGYVQPTREKARIVVSKCRYTSSAKTTVEYEFYFDATDTDNYAGGTFSGVYALLMDAMNGSGNQWDSDSIGTVRVSEGGVSSTYSGTLSVGSAVNRYLIIRDSNGILFQSDIEDYEP